MCIPFAMLLNDTVYKLHDYMFGLEKGVIKYKNWKVSNACLRQLQNTTNWIGSWQSTSLYYLRTPPACATGRRGKWMKIPFEITRWRLRDNIKTDLKEVG